MAPPFSCLQIVRTALPQPIIAPQHPQRGPKHRVKRNTNCMVARHPENILFNQ
jgi:hypothetical protein